MNEKLVSVIMSTCNTDEQYLLRAVESILMQTYKNIELILIIDGGDNVDCLSKYNDNRLHIIRHKNSLGLANRLNEGISLARGDYIARMDSDDYSLPDRLERQVCFMEENPEIDICSTFAKKFGDSDAIVINPYTKSSYICARLFVSNFIIHPTVMFRKESIKKYDIKYNQSYRYSQDYELWARLSNECTFAIIPRIELLYRVHSHQVSKAKKEIQENYFGETVSANLERLGLSRNDIKYIEVLGGRGKLTDAKKLRLFVDRCLLSNGNIHIYNQKVFKRVLYRCVFIVFLREHKLCLSFRYFRWHVFGYSFRKLFLRTKCWFQCKKINKKLLKRKICL